MTARNETRLWIAQRASAALLAIAVSVHLATMIYAVRGGLSAAEIIDRVSGNVGWLIFYLVFVVAVAVHAPIGIRTILMEHSRLSNGTIAVLTVVFALSLLTLGSFAAGVLFAFSD